MRHASMAVPPAYLFRPNSGTTLGICGIFRGPATVSTEVEESAPKMTKFCCLRTCLSPYQAKIADPMRRMVAPSSIAIS